MQRYAEAEETYAECERQAPNDVDRMLFVRGTNYLHMREFEKSHTYLAAALAHSPDHEPTLINYGGQCILPVCITRGIYVLLKSCLLGTYTI